MNTVTCLLHIRMSQLETPITLHPLRIQNSVRTEMQPGKDQSLIQKYEKECETRMSDIILLSI